MFNPGTEFALHASHLGVQRAAPRTATTAVPWAATASRGRASLLSIDRACPCQGALAVILMAEVAHHALEDILGYGVTTLELPQCVGVFLSWLDAPRWTRWVACLNPHSCVVAERDPEFAAALKAADMLLPDGTGILLASRLRHGRLRRRVTGPDFFLASMAALNRRGHGRVFFLGSSEETLRAMAERMSLDYPLVTCCGYYSPPFLEDFQGRVAEDMVSAVNAARPDVLWVGLTAPKQEKWVMRSHAALRVPAVAAIGAAFDFYSGRVSRANRALRVLGLEWLSRLIREPRRMWRRNFISSPKFLWRIVRTASIADR